MNDKLTVVLCGAVVEETIYDKANNICKKHGNDLSKVIEAFIVGIANGDIVIESNCFRRVNENERL